MSVPSLEPNSISDRLDTLGSNGHAWMDGPTMLTLATSPTTDQQMLGQASAITSTAQTMPHIVPSVSNNLTDPVPYSPSDQVVQTVHSIVGTPQFSPDDLTGIQGSLAGMGYAKGLNSDGVWSSDWQAAYTQFANDVKARSYQGEGQLGTERTKGFLHGLLSDLTPAHALSAAVGFVTSIPHDLRQLAGDTLGATEGLGSYIGREAVGVTGKDWSASGQKSIFGSAEHDALTGSGFIEGKTAEEQRQQFLDANGHWSWGRVAGRAIDNVGTALLFVPIVGTAGDIALKFGSKEITDLAVKNAVDRAPGTIARSIVGDYRTLKTATPQFGLLNREAVKAIPLVGRIGPALLKGEGGYYRLRTLLATPYKYAPVRVAGDAFQKASLLGLGAEGVSGLATAVGGDPNSGLAQAVGHQWINPVDVKIGFLKPFGLDSAINDLGLVLHGPIGTGSSAVKHTVDGALTAQTKIVGGALSPLGAIQYAEAASRKTGVLLSPRVKSLEQFYEDFGGEHNFMEWANAKTAQHAAAMQAEHDLDVARQTGEHVPDAVTSVEGQKWAYDRADQIMADPVALSDAWAHLTTDPAQFAARLHREMVNSQTDLEHAQGSGGQAWVETNRALRAVLADPKMRAEMLTPDSFSLHETQVGANTVGGGQAPIMDKAWAHEQMLNQARGRLGLARKDTWTAQTVNRWKQSTQAEWDDFAQRATAAQGDDSALGDLAAEQSQWIARKIVEVGTHGNRDIGVLSRLMSTASGQQGFDGLMKVADDIKSLMASDVFHVADASPQVRAAFAAADSAGYKVVYGKGIGHLAEPPVDAGDLGRALTLRRRTMSNLGLSDVRVSQMTAGTSARVGIKQNLQRLLSEGQIHVPSELWSPDVILGVLEHGYEQGKMAAGSLSAGEKAAMGAATPLLKRQVLAHLEAQDLTREVPRRIGRGTRTTANPEDVEAGYRGMQEQMVSSLGLRDIKRTEIIDALTNPERIPWLAAEPHLAVMPEGANGALSTVDAGKVADAIVSGFAYRPGYMLGGQHIEDMFRAGMGLLGNKWVSKLPGPLEHAVTGLGRMPNAYYRTMTRLRFRLSPVFDLRRVSKTNVKFTALGIRPAMDPAHALLAEGGPQAYRDAHALLDKVWPMHASNPYLDANDQILASNGVWGLFNPRHFAAWAAHDLASQGKSISEIRQTLDKAMTYGDRTAMERTTNTVFFPFSFDKTLYRTLGGYMLDHPAQTLIMLRAFQAYDQFSQDHPGDLTSYVWWQQHAPILNEVNKLNAFAHGIGPGEIGGINAPLLNAFLPQSLPASLRSQTAIKRLIPALGDINRIGSELQQTGRSAYLGVAQAKYRAQILLGQRKATPLNAPESALAPRYATHDALLFKASLMDSLAKVLSYNRKHPNARYSWPVSEQVPAEVRGQPIDSTTIGLIVAHRYPTFDPTKGAALSVASHQKFTAWLGQHSADPTLVSQVSSLAKQVDSLSSHVHADDRDPKALASASQSLRDYALQLVAAHPDFASAYDSFFARALGPRKVPS